MHRSSTLALLIAFAALLLAAQTAMAHSFVDHCTPAIGAALTTPPTELRCTFTEAIDVKQTKFTVLDARSNTVDNGDLKSDPSDNNGTSIILTLNPARLSGGVYTVRWQTVSADGDPTDGQFQFSVNAQPAPAISIISPNENSQFPTAPADVPVSVNIANFAIGQGARHWLVYLNDTLAADVTSNSTTTVLKGVQQGDYGFKVVLEDGTTVVATAGMHLGIGTAPMAMTPMPTAASAAAATPTPKPVTAPSTLPKTGADTSSGPLFILLVAASGLLLLGAGRLALRRR